MTVSAEQDFYTPATITETEKPEVAALMKRLQQSVAVVTFDLDNTAIDESYQPTNLPGLQAAVAHLEKNGVLVNIHSDSPRASISQFADMFGIKDGAQIYEMAGIHFHKKGIDVVLSPEAKQFFQDYKNRAYAAVVAQFPEQNGQRPLITTLQDRNKGKRKGKTYPGYTRGIWFNPYRQLSFGSWAEGINPEGKTYLDKSFHAEMNALLEQVAAGMPNAPSPDQLDWDYNPDYGVNIVKFKHLSSKTPPMAAVLALTGDKPAFMIGDSPADKIDDPRVITLAVANAKDALKQTLAQETTPLPDGINRISQASYTDGVIEHMDAIARHLGFPRH